MTKSPLNHEHLDTWDRVPRDGPLIMVTAGNGEKQDSRQWIDPIRPLEEVRIDVRSAVGDQAFFGDDWAVIDQIGLGSTMIPEHLSIEALHAEAQRRLRSTAGALTGDEQDPEGLVGPEGVLWRTATDLAQSFLDASGVAAALEVLPEPADSYVTVDLERVGRDLAIQLGGTVDEDGKVFIPGSEA